MVKHRVRKPSKRAVEAGREVVRRKAFAHLPPVEFEGEEYPDYIGMADGYVDAVISGLVIENQFVIKAAKRYRKMRKSAEKRDNPYFWSPAHAVEVCAFAERWPMSTGGRLVIEPCQAWWLVAIFGFREISEGGRNVRWVREAHLEMARKNGKSEIGAIIDIYCFLFEGEEGSQVLLGASSKAQARKVFDPIYKGLQREEDLRMMFALKVTAKEIRQPQTGGYITTVSSIGRKEDGHNPHVGHIDEVHAISDAFYEVMRSSFGARYSQLFLKTTTAGHYFHGPGYAQRQRIERVLNEQESADRLFAVIYTIDPEDLKTPFKWSNIIKANPMLGVIKRDSAYIDDIEGARHNPFTRGEFIVKTLNFYAQTNERAIQSADWDKCKEEGLSLLDYVGQRCFGGIDLASRDDMTAIALIFEHKTVPGAVAVFVEHYCPAEAPGFYDDRVSALYEQWKEQGFLKTTPGGILDFDVIEKRIIELDLIFNGEAWVFDEAQHTQMISKLQKKNVEAGAIRATAVNLAEPTKDMLALIRDGKFRHDGNPILRWNALNVRIQGSELPRPAKDKAAAHMKIDGISAASHANTARLSRLTIKKPKEDKPPPNYDRIVRTL